MNNVDIGAREGANRCWRCDGARGGKARDPCALQKGIAGKSAVIAAIVGRGWIAVLPCFDHPVAAAGCNRRVHTNVVGTGICRAGVVIIALIRAGATTWDGRVYTSVVGTGVRRAGVAVIALTCTIAATRDERVKTTTVLTDIYRAAVSVIACS